MRLTTPLLKQTPFMNATTSSYSSSIELTASPVVLTNLPAPNYWLFRHHQIQPFGQKPHLVSSSNNLCLIYDKVNPSIDEPLIIPFIPSATATVLKLCLQVFF